MKRKHLGIMIIQAVNFYGELACKKAKLFCYWKLLYLFNELFIFTGFGNAINNNSMGRTVSGLSDLSAVLWQISNALSLECVKVNFSS